MGIGKDVVKHAARRHPRPAAPAVTRRSGVRQSQADGSITVLEDWGTENAKPPERRSAPIVDRSPRRVFD